MSFPILFFQFVFELKAFLSIYIKYRNLNIQFQRMTNNIITVHSIKGSAICGNALCVYMLKWAFQQK